jgi:hypothetical protein
MARVLRNGEWSNALSFTVTGGDAATLSPNRITMLVGDTQKIQALDDGGQPIASLNWTSSDPAVVSVSVEDGTALTALAPGHAVVTAGGASADVTVSAGDPGLPGSLPDGTVLWSVPGNAPSIVPAVPSPNGVADVFAIDYDVVRAITTEGVTAWTANVSDMGLQPVPDFEGGLIGTASDNAYDPISVVKIDGTTGQRQVVALVSPGLVEVAAVHPDGTVFLRAVGYEGQQSIIGVDSINGGQRFSVPVSGEIYGLIVAGDGFAYASYFTYELDETMVHARFDLLRISSSGAATHIPLTQWSREREGGELWGTNTGMVTNSDEGILITWEDGGGPQMALVSGGSVNRIESPIVPGAWPSAVIPKLQMQDGSFVGTASGEDGDYMIAFNASGSVRWMMGGYYEPSIATADGGVIAGDPYGTTIVVDQNGSVTGQMASLPVQSWTANVYQSGSVQQVVAPLLNIAVSWWPFARGNASGNDSASQQPWYAPLKSCPGAAVRCPKEAIESALSFLRALLRQPCPACQTWVFDKLPERTQASFSAYVSRKARLWDGTRSYVPANTALCRSGLWNQFVCKYGSESVHNYMLRTGTDVLAKTPSEAGEGMQVFFDPAESIFNVLSVPNPSEGDQGVTNQALLFHEALHGHPDKDDKGREDSYFQSRFGIPVTFQTCNITEYLRVNVIPGGLLGATACGN